jgi:hypothetical protein
MKNVLPGGVFRVLDKVVAEVWMITNTILNQMPIPVEKKRTVIEVNR